jgi:GMP synthase-like glutamine amidotransferase
MILKRRMPVFGIGVGMQLLNVTQGGNLYLHIPEDMPESLPHRDSLDRAHRHGLEVARNSMMERVYGDGEIRVNSMHHMAIDELGSAFRVTARCPDGVIEAIESVDPEKWFAVGTQFHPEAESASALDLRSGLGREVKLIANTRGQSVLRLPTRFAFEMFACDHWCCTSENRETAVPRRDDSVASNFLCNELSLRHGTDLSAVSKITRLRRVRTAGGGDRIASCQSRGGEVAVGWVRS